MVRFLKVMYILYFGFTLRVYVKLSKSYDGSLLLRAFSSSTTDLHWFIWEHQWLFHLKSQKNSIWTLALQK